MSTCLYRVRGSVQGVGFRPTVARLARQCGLHGFVRNDAEGVLIALRAPDAACERFVSELMASLPPLAKVESISRLTPQELGDASLLAHLERVDDFRIEASVDGLSRTEVSADAATCAPCMEEALDPHERRYRYPFGSCTHCGPRFSITERVPYDREHTSMRKFALCEECAAEYAAEADRRYHAQPIACHRCGPKATLHRSDGRAFDFTRYSMLDMVDAAGSLLMQGEIVAVKGLGGYVLCCDATNDDAVRKLRERKRRGHRAFAMMVRDLGVLERYADLDDEPGQGAPRAELTRLLAGAEAPIVLLRARHEPLPAKPRKPNAQPPAPRPLSAGVAPDQPCQGFMLPHSPLHRLMLARVDRPVVCTSGNLSAEPQCIDDAHAREALSSVADWFLVHDRDIVHRVDDSVVRPMAGGGRLLRRARGYAPRSEPLPEGFVESPAVFASGSHLKSTFALARAGRAVLSTHLGDLDRTQAAQAYEKAFGLLRELFGHRPEAVAVDMHPEYRSRQLGLDFAAAEGLPVIEVQHHHAHVAACLAENLRPRSANAVLGIALDGIGYGMSDTGEGELWGGEFLLTDYRHCTRLATFKPVALLGGDRAAVEPWRCLYAHLRAEMSWPELRMSFGDVKAVQDLSARPVELLEQMLSQGTSAPLASSAGRLFDAVAAALGLYADGVEYEGQAAMALEGLVTPEALAAVSEPYPFGIPRLRDSGLPYLEPLGMWRALLGDLWAGTSPALMAARFHVGLADGIVRMALRLRDGASFDTVALSGGCFQNRVLLELVHAGLTRAGLSVLTHAALPPNDGCIAFGQVVVASALLQEC